MASKKGCVNQTVAMINAALKAADVKGIVQAMRDHDKYTREVILPKYGDLLPK